MATTVSGYATQFITFSRASNATVVDSDGVIKWAPHNLVLNSAAPVTQSITVISGAQYTVDMTGSGSIALSNAGSGTVTTGSPVTITASSTTLTLTLTGTVSTMWAYRSDLGGMQANASGSLYNVTTGSAYYGPRRDFDPVTLACKGLLVEEQRSNLLLRSAEFDSASWVKSSATVTANASVSPDGASTADKIVENTATTGHSVYQTVAVSNATAYTFSVFAKASGRSQMQMQYFDGTTNKYPVFDLTTGGKVTDNGIGSSWTATSVGNGWWRFTITVTSAGTSADCYLYPASSGAVNYTGNGTDGILVWGAQLEAGSFATSYIPTGSATATRSADVASVSTQAFPYSATEGTLVANVLSPNGQSSNRRIWSVNDDANGTTNSLELRNNSTNVSILTIAGATTGTVTSTWPDTVFKIGAAWAAFDYALVVDGGTVETGSSGTLPTGATTLRLGNFTTTQSRWLCGHISQITYLPRRISNAELQTRTA